MSVPGGMRSGTAHRVVGVVGALAVLGACVWCLRGLGTPTVGFDARAVWLLRAGWFLQSHHQLLVKMKVSDVPLIQSTYPPLVSASGAVAASVTGNQSVRLGVVVVALLNTCALTAAALALVEAGRACAVRLAAGIPTADTAGTAGSRPLPVAPMVVGVAATVALVFVAFGITEPFMTNGYADPLWSLAAVAALAYGLQLGTRRAEQGAAVILVLVTGMTKNEGLATGAALVVLIALRVTPGHTGGGARAALVAAGRPRGPGARRHRGLARADAGDPRPWGDLVVALTDRHVAGRARATAEGMAPYLHVLVLAAPSPSWVGWSSPACAGRRGGQ